MPIQLESLESDALQQTRAGKPANGMRLNSNNVSLGWPEKWPDMSDDVSSGEWPEKWPEFVEGKASIPASK